MQISITIPENLEEKSNINGMLTNDSDFILRSLNQAFDKVLDFEKSKLETAGKIGLNKG